MTDLAALPRQFLAAIDALTDGDDDRICLAISGGADSMAMLLLAAQAMPERVIAATVNHGLREAAADEADFVAQHCRRLGIAHETLASDAAITGNIQSQARQMRYALLRRHAAERGCAFIATAHHRDDQLETFLMRLARGSGIDGLSGVRRRNGNIIRPVLELGRADLEAVCAAHAVSPVHDPSNDDDSYDRVRMRQWLREHPLPFDGDAALNSAAALAEAGDALAWMTNQLSKERISFVEGSVQADVAGLPAEVKRRLFLHALSMMPDGLVPRGKALSLAMAKLDNGENAMLGDLLITPGKRWHIAKAPPRSQ